MDLSKALKEFVEIQRINLKVKELENEREDLELEMEDLESQIDGISNDITELESDKEDLLKDLEEKLPEGADIDDMYQAYLNEACNLKHMKEDIKQGFYKNSHRLEKEIDKNLADMKKILPDVAKYI